jgi:putative NADH-flavin reductase
MRVLLIGATGKVGAPVLRELLDRGHDVTAVVRDATRLPAETPSLRHRSGDVFDADFLTQAAEGTEVIVCSVALRDPAQRERTPTDLMRGAGQAAVTVGARLVALGGAGSLRTPSGADLVDTPGFPEVAKPESLGFRAALHDLVASAPAELLWTVVSPAASIEPDGARTGSYRTSDDELLLDAQGASRISAADLAAAVVDEVENAKHARRRFAVAY